MSHARAEIYVFPHTMRRALSAPRGANIAHGQGRRGQARSEHGLIESASVGGPAPLGCRRALTGEGDPNHGTAISLIVVALAVAELSQTGRAGRCVGGLSQSLGR